MRIVSLRTPALAVFSVLTMAMSCAPVLAQGLECTTAGEVIRLPGRLEESSGVAQSTFDAGVFWSHADSGNDADLFAMDLTGERVGKVEVDVRARDWEDIAIAPCGDYSCMYVADTGDNQENRKSVWILRFPEPDPRDETAIEPERFRIRLPDGPRDMEALIVLPDERVYLVTKGRNHPVTVYRYPGALRSDTVVTLEEVQTLTEGPMAPTRFLTGGDASADGSLVALRTYTSLEFFNWTPEGTLSPLDGGFVDLRTLGEPQGEGVAFATGNRMVLTTEAKRNGRAFMTLLSCTLPAE